MYQQTYYTYYTQGTGEKQFMAPQSTPLPAPECDESGQLQISPGNIRGLVI
jgi:hypothetical protein